MYKIKKFFLFIYKKFYLIRIKNEFKYLFIYLKWKPTKKSQKDKISELGIIKINENFKEFADYIIENYSEKLIDDGNGVKNYFLPLSDKYIINTILKTEIYSKIYNYYGSNPYLRNDPLLQEISPTEKFLNFGNGSFHVDRYCQISVMILLHDLEISETHMEYILGSHKRTLGFLNLYLDFNNIKKRIISNNENNIYHIIGKKGDCFIFNTMGLHKANYKLNSKRSIFHLNFTNGHNLYNYTNKETLNHLKKIKDDSAEYEVILRKKKNLIFAGENHKYF